MKVASIVGARPQFIKAMPVSRELRKAHTEILIHTGQHYDHNMSKIFFDELQIPQPEYNLQVGSGTHGMQTGNMLIEIERVLLSENPDLVLVYGDTNSTLAGALAAVKLHIPVAHVEAGLRSFNKLMPEEINRILTDHVSELLFCPTQTAVDNLSKEGITKGVHLTGDVMFDAVLYNSQLADEKSTILETLNLKKGAYYLATVHRPCNTDNPVNLQNIIDAFGELNLPVVFPLHPRTRAKLEALDIQLEPLVSNDSICQYANRQFSNIIFTEPVGYLDMLRLEKNARKILTDSGGVQKEAYFFHIHCITLRDETEWVETVEAGWNTLVGSDTFAIVSEIQKPIPSTWISELYGNGNASKSIVQIMEDGR